MCHYFLPINIRIITTILCLTSFLSVVIIKDASALAQRAGDFELAVDAPWRIEPRILPPRFCDASLSNCNSVSAYEYGSVPIQVSIHDADFPNSSTTEKQQQLIEIKQSGESNFQLFLEFLTIVHRKVLYVIRAALKFFGFSTVNPNDVFLHPVTHLQNFISLTVYEKNDGVYQRQNTYEINDAHEIERTTGYWRWAAAGSPAPQRPGYELCRRWQGDDCSQLLGLRQSSEWHGTFKYRPVFGDRPGRDVRLRLDLKLNVDIEGRLKEKTYSHFVNVHLGERPLPKFDRRWVYGDLHYHAQGTDNDGESAYSYRGVLQTMGAMGLDFAFATDHASNSRQIVSATPVGNGSIVEPIFRGLRDLSPDRFAFYIDLLNGSEGANKQVLSTPWRTDWRGTLAAPQLFLGSEVDVIPEFAAGETPIYSGACTDLPAYARYLEGGVDYHVHDSVCNQSDLLDPTSDGRMLVRDVQGPAFGHFTSTRYYGRQHLLHLPTDPQRKNAFIPSNTSKYGGATRRLGEILDVELGRRNKGFFFLAHPLAQASGKEIGRLGPDILPYSNAQLLDAFNSPHFLGLQTWNENGQLKSRINSGDAKDYNGQFIPVNDLQNWKHEKQQYNAYFAARNSELWEKMLLWGLDPAKTTTINWLEPGQPRRVFMAGGSDAHGDFNFRREGYFTGTSGITDTAIGTPRNLVFAGTANGEEISASAGSVRPYSQGQIVQALRNGNFSVTDGPAIRIAYDRNRNSVIDDEDIPMGSIVARSNECSFPVIVEWKSTPEFGRLENIDLYVGVRSDVHEKSVVYQTWRFPGGYSDISPSDIGGSTTFFDSSRQQSFVQTPNYLYWYDPTEETLAINITYAEGYAGQRVIHLDPNDFPVGKTRSQCRDTNTNQTTTKPFWQSYDGNLNIDNASISSNQTATESSQTQIATNYLNGSSKNMTASSIAKTNRRINRPGLLGGGQDFLPPDYVPPACERDYIFEQAERPDRLYIRAVATNTKAPRTDHNCTPYAVPPANDKRPMCIHRRAYSNPLWVTFNKQSIKSQLCAPLDRDQVFVGNVDTDTGSNTGPRNVINKKLTAKKLQKISNMQTLASPKSRVKTTRSQYFPIKFR